ncbi:beta-barrel assembly-enhancing protease [Pseudoduganella umbonata]|uniref:M48 family metallopeptidase n=1 Tax=Pseudoduganella umbonata TaxID=864828 RepID=A0ABX5UJP7_9BURK|nr:M48 family metalloprotease [Pseudoduganella umbonata]QCP12014.1 M48 family metallopeptidase [Pseudoduganella umbonata]
MNRYHSTVNAIRFPRRFLLSLAVSLAVSSISPAARAQAPTNVPSLPSLGDTSREALSPIIERKLGEEIMRDIRFNRDYLDDPPIIDYLNNLGNTLVTARPGARGEANYDYFFFAVRDPMLNAFALPGGFIGVHSALLLAAQSESELASVLSHEIGHVAQRHIARQLGEQKTDALIPLAAMVLAALVAKDSPDAAMGVMMGGQGVAIQRQLNFGREAEREADRVGFQIMGAAGYETSGMVAFFQRMQNATKMYDTSMPWLMSHPLTTERIADIQARIREAPYRQRVDALDFFLVRSRARVLQDQSTKGYAQSEEFFRNQMAQQSRHEIAAGQYGMAFLALQRDDYKGAQSWLDKARVTVERPPAPGAFSSPLPKGIAESVLAYTSLEIKVDQEKNPEVLAQAIVEGEQAHARYPLSRGIAWQYADALIKGGKPEQAERFLRDQIQQYRSEPELQDLLAQAYSKMGKIALQHIALAESYALLGGTMAALDQLQLARKSSDASFYEQAVIDAREREWQAKRREAMGEKGKDKDFGSASFRVSAGTTGAGSGAGAGTGTGAAKDDPFGRNGNKAERDCADVTRPAWEPSGSRSDPLQRRDPFSATARNCR